MTRVGGIYSNPKKDKKRVDITLISFHDISSKVARDGASLLRRL